MSLGIAIKGPEGIVLASDSRATIVATSNGKLPFEVHFDNASKLFQFSGEHRFVGAVSYGSALVGDRLLHGWLPEFEADKLADKERLSVKNYAELLAAFFKSVRKPDDASFTMLVGGYDPDPEKAYGRVFQLRVPGEELQEMNPGDKGFGMSWGGQLAVASTLIHGYHPAILNILAQQHGLNDKQVRQFQEACAQNTALRIPYQVLPLQDSVDFAILIIETTISAQSLSMSQRGVGGVIEVVTVTRKDGVTDVQRRTLHARRSGVKS